MSQLITRDSIIRAISLPGNRRSDYDLNPGVKRDINGGRPLRAAAVLCPIIERAHGLSVILTQRPDTMREHAGQVAFPGGKIDEGDVDAEAAALREANEEIGLPHHHAEVLGEIDHYETGTGFRVAPIVAMIHPSFEPVPDPREVAAVFETPLDYLMNPANLETRTGHWGGRERQYYAYDWEDRYIWGATAGMLKSLADRLAALWTRIAPDWLTAAPTQTVMAALASARPLFVGGCVRDALMGRDCLDIDIAVTTPPNQTMMLAQSAGLKAIPTGLDHGVVTLIVDGAPFEIATLRRDVATDGRRAVVAFTDRIEEDAERRDFTMNALYADAAGEVIDPLGEGLIDLAARRIRFIGNAVQRLREDYLRILRFFRFHAQFGIAPLDAEGLTACLAERSGLDMISAERIGAEMRKLLAAPNPGPALEGMGPILTQILPGAVWSAKLLEAEAALGLSPQPLRRLASLNADEVEGLRLSNAEQSHFKKVSLARKLAVYEAAYRYGEDVALDSAAIDLNGGATSTAIRDDITQAAAAIFPVTAKDLMDRGLAPGPNLGATLKTLETRWIAERFAPTRETLLSSLAEGS